MTASPKGASVVMANRQGPVTTYRVADGFAIEHEPHGTRGHALFENEDTFLIMNDEGQVYRGGVAQAGLAGPVLTVEGGVPRRLRAVVDRQLIVTAGANLSVYDMATGERTVLNEDTVRPWGMAVSPDRKRIAHGGFDSFAHLYRLDTLDHRRLVGHQSAVGYVAFSPDGHRLLSAGADRTLRLWSVSDGESAAMHGHRLFVLGLAVSQTPSSVLRALTSDDSGEIRVWNFSAPTNAAGLAAWLDDKTTSTVDFERAATTPNQR